MHHGVVATVNSDSDERARRLNIDAAKMMRYGGLTEDEALKTITYNGAVQLGVEKRVGSIEVGKDADVVIWNGDPLSVYSMAETTFIDGEIFFDNKRDSGEARPRWPRSAPRSKQPIAGAPAWSHEEMHT